LPDVKHLGPAYNYNTKLEHGMAMPRIATDSVLFLIFLVGRGNSKCRQNSIIRGMHVNAKTTIALSGNSVTLHKSSA
jgi:hypothetical protein